MMIKNYTSGVPPERSVLAIERKLVSHGANNIMKEYDGFGTLSGITFVITVDGKMIPFKLPSRVDRVEKRLIESVKRARKGTVQKMKDQAARTAWKILSDWVDVQMTLIDLDQVEFLEVFLSYTYDPKNQQTFFERVKSGGLKLLNS